MPPSDYGNRCIEPGEKTVMNYVEHESPVGTLMLAATECGVAGVYFSGHRRFTGHHGWTLDGGQPLLQRLRSQLDEYFAGERREFDLPLDLAGTAFQKRVWSRLLALPFGSRESYGAQARAIGQPDAVRAVGSAIGRNPISIVVPCHRVVAGNGALTGYAGGLERKHYLLALEASVCRTNPEQTGA
jgi:methylated-DNA-[protein]-cysteine S-methyltransferase